MVFWPTETKSTWIEKRRMPGTRPTIGRTALRRNTPRAPLHSKTPPNPAEQTPTAPTHPPAPTLRGVVGLDLNTNFLLANWGTVPAAHRAANNSLSYGVHLSSLFKHICRYAHRHLVASHSGNKGGNSGTGLLRRTRNACIGAAAGTCCRQNGQNQCRKP